MKRTKRKGEEEKGYIKKRNEIKNKRIERKKIIKRWIFEQGTKGGEKE